MQAQLTNSSETQEQRASTGVSPRALAVASSVDQSITPLSAISARWAAKSRTGEPYVR